MTESNQKEMFSQAFVRAIAAKAGFSVYVPELDDDSVDIVIAKSGSQGTYRSLRIEVQLKCTAVAGVADDNLKHRIKMKNYDDLRQEDFLVPRILIVVTVPKDVESWIVQTDTKLELYHCGYWKSLRGMPEVKSEADEPKVTVEISKDQQFTAAELKRLMDMVGRGEKP